MKQHAPLPPLAQFALARRIGATAARLEQGGPAPPSFGRVVGDDTGDLEVRLRAAEVQVFEAWQLVVDAVGRLEHARLAIAARIGEGAEFVAFEDVRHVGSQIHRA